MQPTTPENRISADIIDRGAVVFAEMQQNKVAEGNVADTMPYRLDNYANGLAFRDWGYAKPGKEKEKGKKDSTSKSGTPTMDDIRRGKRDGNIISRSIVGVAYQGYGTVATKVWSDSHVLNGTSNGRAFASVSIGNVEDYAKKNFLKSGQTELDEKKVENEIKRLKGKISDLLPEFKQASQQLVGEVFAVFTMSHLFTKNIVANFLKEVQAMCKILEVNMDDIKKVGLGTEDYEALYGPSIYKTKAEEAEKLLQTILQANRDLLKDLPDDQKELAQKLLKRRNVEVAPDINKKKGRKKKSIDQEIAEENSTSESSSPVSSPKKEENGYQVTKKTKDGAVSQYNLRSSNQKSSVR
jgi:hypothetical protein